MPLPSSLCWPRTKYLKYPRFLYFCVVQIATKKQLFLHLQSGNCEASVDEAGHVVIAAGGTFPLQVLLVASFWKHIPPLVSFCEGE